MQKKILVILSLLILSVVCYIWLSMFVDDGEVKELVSVIDVPTQVQVKNVEHQESLKERNSGAVVVKANSSIKPAYDPRLEDLKVTKDNGLIEYVYGDGGIVIKEIDKDPSSPSFKKDLKIYQYQNNKVSSITRYQYFNDQTFVTTLNVTYNIDGSIKDYRELAEYQKKPASTP
jgi:hypothetical protein